MEHKTHLRRLGLFDAKVPRFTSYPPANRFSGDIDVATTQSWLTATPHGSEVSLYIHIPFCRRLCYFCACRTQGTKTDAPLERYVRTLITEIDMVRDQLPVDVTVRRLHFGGGTPTLLSPDYLTALLDALHGSFGLDDLDEFSVEIDPTEVDKARIDVLARYGMNRASLGVQDFDPRVQKAIGREQGFETTRATVDLLAEAGVDEVNIDLLYGLPFQTMGSLEKTIDQVLQLNASRLALYGYAHVPWVSKRQVVIPFEALPDPETRFDLFERAQKLLLGQGYLQVGIDHFARPHDGLARAMIDRRLARSFQGYTDDRVPRLIGLGASSISKYPEGYVQNQPATAMYQGMIEAGRLAAARGVVLTPEDCARGALIEQLMCYFDASLSALHDPYPAAGQWLAHLADEYPEAIDFDGDRLSLRRWARPLVRVMAAQLGQTRTTPDTYSAAI
ncbi:MAG: oxygen-independent coproporphyrinogen III oxidase [Pseudomonadota bacterium]|nr:oxygen-independent coproporphyrinogen III oxidase [Pseudomonadota bacterium]